MVTPDKDFAQLVSENVFMYRPARMGNGIEIWGIPEVQAKFEVERPEQVIDYLGMMGDSVDNIPGLPGVGDKTAKKFISQFGSMENLLENTDQLSGKLKEKIEANKELGLLSKELATILLNVPVQFDEKEYELNTPDIEKVKALFQELEFRRMTEHLLRIFSAENSHENEIISSIEPEKKLPSNTVQFDLFSMPGTGEIGNEISHFKTLKNTSHWYQIVDNALAIELLLKKMTQQPCVCFDTETTSLNPIDAELVGIAFSWEAHKGYYVPFPEDQNLAQEIIEKMRPFF
jgi:DNA polymerase-1